MEFIKSNSRVLCLVVLLMMSTTLLSCDATGINEGTITIQFYTEYNIYISLVIQTILSNSFNLYYICADTNGMLCYLVLGTKNLDDVCRPFRLCNPPKKSYADEMCKIYCQSKNFNPVNSYCEDIYCCCSII
jgi:hypothetical protein